MRRVGIGLALAFALAALANSSCEDPVAALFGVTAVSTRDQGHEHRCTIPLSDIETPPMGGRTYTTTTDSGHSHTVHLSEVQLRDLQQRGAAVSVTSSTAPATGPPPPHTHRFDFVR